METMLELKGVVAGYHGARVLQGVDIVAERGSITCIVGPNGAGKSTLLKTLSGVVEPMEGTIILDGKVISGLTAGQILARGVVQVPQQHALFPTLTVMENVLMGAYIIRRHPRLVRERLAEVEQLIPLIKDRANDRAGNLSGGQRRAVEFARSLMLDPMLVLLDEPSLGLDPRGLAKVRELIDRMRERGRTILLVEQNVRLGLGVADYGVVLEGGRVRLSGRASEVLNHPEIADLYLGGTVRGRRPSADEDPDEDEETAGKSYQPQKKGDRA